MVRCHAFGLHFVLEDLGGPDVFPADEPPRPILGDVGEDVLRLAGHGDGVEPHEEAERGMAPITSPPTMKTFAVLAGCRPKISTMSSRVTQMPRYLPMRSMAGSFDDGAAGGRRRLGPLRPLCPSPAVPTAVPSAVQPAGRSAPW